MDFPHYFEVGMKSIALIFIGLVCILFIKEMVIASIIGLANFVSGGSKNKKNQKGSTSYPKDFLSKKNLKKNGIII